MLFENMMKKLRGMKLHKLCSALYVIWGK